MEAAKILCGKGVAINSVSSQGDSLQFGKFSFPNASSVGFGFGDGVLLSTGSVLNSVGPKETSSLGKGYRSKERSIGSPGDDDNKKILDTLSPGKPIKDRAVLTVDFSTLGDTVEFEYIFASSEYPEFVNQGYFDIFCLLMKGPGIQPDLKPNGTIFYTDSFKNLSTINGAPISIKTINANTNSQYFRNGITEDYTDFDGYTVSIKIKVPVQCGKRYLLKIAISDVGDGAMDSYILLKKGSLKSPGDVGDIVIPNIDLCKNSTYTLNIDGSNSFNYLWNTGATGKQINFTANSSNQQFWVDITNPQNGCKIRKTATIGEVYSNNNLLPFVKGINDRYDFDTMVTAGDLLNFQITGYDNNANEKILLDWNNGISSPNVSLIGDLSNPIKKPIVNFLWPTSTVDIGVHKFYIYVRDNNACAYGYDTFEFSITVICDKCPMNVLIENKNPTSGVRLKKYYYAANSIVAGHSVDPMTSNGLVLSESDAPTEFRAGNEIVLDTGFYTEDNAEFTAWIEPTCIVTAYCDTCCLNDTGFRFTLSGIFSPNGDGINDVWQVLDFASPYCAYDAYGFELTVYDRDVIIYQLIDINDDPSCCKYHSPRDYSDANTNIASIYWNGSYNGGSPRNGTYYPVLRLYDCNGNFKDFSFTTYVIGVSQEPPMLTIPDDNSTLSIKCYMFPNPVDKVLKILTENWPENIHSGNVEIWDNSGKKVVYFTIENKEESSYSLESLASGLYLVKVNIGNKTFYQNIIKQ